MKEAPGQTQQRATPAQSPPQVLMIQGIMGDVAEDVEGAMATPTGGVEVSVPERHNDFKGEKRVCRGTSTTYKHTSPLINTSTQHMK